MIAAEQAHARQQQCDFLSVSFGYTAELAHFGTAVVFVWYVLVAIKRPVAVVIPQWRCYLLVPRGGTLSGGAATVKT